MSVASLSPVKIPPVLVKPAQNISYLRRHPRMLPMTKPTWIIRFTRYSFRERVKAVSSRGGPEVAGGGVASGMGAADPTELLAAPRGSP